ncbi:autorepressor SdpR family transcription factor [Lacticaseibacillus nasuensis]|uniref:autorepressor SdpR family transcription factor n=1 Tax=Lacticaseibacillus nasuensis TaxID=944671 RepID=UPI0006CF78CA|nr:autorepressor SdpR family transcription factor [Lacticaseibacillus nasuensis]
MAMSDTLKAISDPVRRQILNLLKEEPKPAGAIAAQFDLTAATVSYHLKLLKQAHLITERREKNFIYYDLNASVFEEVLSWIYSLGIGADSHDKN